MHTHTYTYIHIHTYLHTYIHRYMHTYIYIYVYILYFCLFDDIRVFDQFHHRSCCMGPMISPCLASKGISPGGPAELKKFMAQIGWLQRAEGHDQDGRVKVSDDRGRKTIGLCPNGGKVYSKENGRTVTLGFLKRRITFYGLFMEKIHR